jgi:hypothetical protein
MMRLPKEKRDKLILVVIATVAILAGLWLGVIRTRGEQIDRSRDKLAKAKEKLETAKKIIGRADQAEADMIAATKRLGAIEDTMASGDLYPWALLLVEKARGGHDIKIIDVPKPGKTEVKMLAQFPYEAATFSVRGTAFFHDLGKFLADFENTFPYFRVQNISLGPGSEGMAGTDGLTAGMSAEKLLFKMDIVALTKPTE